MKIMTQIRLALILVLSSIATLSYGQDPHFSQFGANAVVLNPALTGIYDSEDIRIACAYRSQWGALSSNIATTGVAFDMPFRDRWGLGGYATNYDLANVINTIGFGGSASYQVSDPNQKSYVLSTGMQIGFLYKRTSDERLLFDNQYVSSTGFFDSDLPTGESYERLSRVMPDISIGFSYRSTDKDKKFNPYGGLSLFHVTTPNESLIGNIKSQLPIRWVVSGGGVITPDDKWTIDPNFLFMKQRTATEINVGAQAMYKIQSSFYHVIGGLYYRYQDAVIVHAGLKHNRNMYRISYDITTSPLKEFNNNRGAIEFSVIYYGRKKEREQPMLN